MPLVEYKELHSKVWQYLTTRSRNEYYLTKREKNQYSTKTTQMTYLSIIFLIYFMYPICIFIFIIIPYFLHFFECYLHNIGSITIALALNGGTCIKQFPVIPLRDGDQKLTWHFDIIKHHNLLELALKVKNIQQYAKIRQTFQKHQTGLILEMQGMCAV